jgi:ABC-2 type transport system permease protein
MRFWAVFKKSMREQLRNLLVLSLTLVFGAFFVFLYWMFFPSNGSTAYTILVLNQDAGAEIDGTLYNAGSEAIQAITALSYPNGTPMLHIVSLSDQEEIEPRLRDREGQAYVIFPEDFSRELVAARNGDRQATTRLEFGGDLTNPYYMVGAIMATSAIDAYAQQAAQMPSLIHYDEHALGGSGTRSEFEIYVPGMLVFAVVLMIFSASMVVTHEVESGTLYRLKLTRMTAFDLLGGISLSLVLVGVASELLAFATALGLGFHSYGPVWVAILVGAFTSLSVIGLGMIVAAFSKTTAQAFIIANFPLAFFMFFSGAIMPIPEVTLFTISGQAVGLYDLLPPRHAVIALNKIFTLGAGLGDVTYELVMLTFLSVLYFAVGMWIFERRHLRTA